MSSIAKGKEVVQNLRSLADSLEEFFISLNPTDETPAPKKEPAARKAKAPVEDIAPPAREEDTPPAPVEEELKKVTLEEIRAVLAELSQAGKREEVKKMIENCNATKLTEIDPKYYSALMIAARKLNG